MEIYTIGFTKKGAREFFGLLDEADIQQLIDTRIRNRSQLAGFAKRDDLKYFLEVILDVDYQHQPDLAPTEELLDDWRNDEISWEEYEDRFFALMREREIEKKLSPDYFEKPTVLLCSEHKPDKCHRRLIVEYLDDEWDDVAATHLQ